MTALVGHFGRDAERQHIAGSNLHVGNSAKGHGDFFGFVWVAGYPLNIFGFATDDGRPVLQQFDAEIKIGTLIVAVHQAEPDVQIADSSEFERGIRRRGSHVPIALKAFRSIPGESLNLACVAVGAVVSRESLPLLECRNWSPLVRANSGAGSKSKAPLSSTIPITRVTAPMRCVSLQNNTAEP